MSRPASLGRWFHGIAMTTSTNTRESEHVMGLFGCSRCAVIKEAKRLSAKAEKKLQAGNKRAWERFYEESKGLYMKSIPMKPCPNCSSHAHVP